MNLRFYIDPESGEPHIHGHGLEEDDIASALADMIEDQAGRDGTRVAVGRTRHGRFIRVVYVRESRRAVFVITAYPLRPKALASLRRRIRRIK